jgi:predicted nucleic acid-binding protein
MTDEVARRAIEVQGSLAASAQHRSVSIPDLLIAATAEHYGLTVLHYEADFDRIAKLTGQPVEWIVPRGSSDR